MRTKKVTEVVSSGLKTILTKLGVSKPSKKTKTLIKKTTGKLVKHLKKVAKKAASKRAKKAPGKSPKKSLKKSPRVVRANPRR